MSFADCYIKHGVIPELMDAAPPAALKLVYHGHTLESGVENTPTQVKLQPLSITWPGMKPDHFYTIIMIDPDMPARDTPIKDKTQVLHWLMVNIPGVGLGGRNLAPYIGSGPPPGTGKHRYNFLVYDEGSKPKDYSSITPMDLIDVDRRVFWKLTEPGKLCTLREFVTWAGFGSPIAGNFYIAEWDKAVDDLWKTFNHFYN